MAYDTSFIGPIRVAGIAVISLLLALGVMWTLAPWPTCTTVRVSQAGIFHETTSPNYGQVTDPIACYATVADAEAAGYRRSASPLRAP